MPDILDKVYYGNSVKEYAASLLTFVLVAGGFLLIRRALVGRLKWLAEKTETKFDDVLVETLVVPNSFMASSRVQNFRDLRERTGTLKFTVAYGTPAAKLEALPTQVRAVTKDIL